MDTRLSKRDDEDGLQKVNRAMKQFRLIPEEGMVGGVCAGIAYRLNLPLWLIRICWAGLVLCAGTGVLLYLALWFFVPDADRVPRDFTKRTGA